MLEQNYRSTKNIITAASNLISNNNNQVPKELWTDNEEGEKIMFKELLDERQEANFIVSAIREFVRKGKNPRDVVVLYRTHAQSRAIEEALISSGFPYHIVGGIKFYERREIKDILAYLKFITNPADIVSFDRIYNTPPRGVGKKSFDSILKEGPNNVFNGLAKTLTNGEISPKQLIALKNFNGMLNEIVIKTKNAKVLFLRNNSQIKNVLRSIIPIPIPEVI